MTASPDQNPVGIAELQEAVKAARDVATQIMFSSDSQDTWGFNAAYEAGRRLHEVSVMLGLGAEFLPSLDSLRDAQEVTPEDVIFSPSADEMEIIANSVSRIHDELNVLRPGCTPHEACIHMPDTDLLSMAAIHAEAVIDSLAQARHIAPEDLDLRTPPPTIYQLIAARARRDPDSPELWTEVVNFENLDW